jgi:3-mercaptopyruvate sulfurtransferase SseA
MADQSKAGSATHAQRFITSCGAGSAASSLAHVLVRLDYHTSLSTP